MGVELGEIVDNAFRNIHPDNPLGQMNAEDREYLWALLKVYDKAKNSSEVPKYLELLEEVSRTAAAARSLAGRIEAQAEEERLADEVRAIITSFQVLPNLLTRYANEIGRLLDSIGKPGHKQRAAANHLIVMASEFVNIKTGTYHYEHLSELFQTISKTPEQVDFSGDAIRKKREQLRENFPELYADAIRRVGGESAG